MEKVLGFLSVLLGLLAVWQAKRTDILVKSEDERAKKIIDEGNKRTQEMMLETQKMMAETQKMMAETQKMMAETQKIIERMDERHKETLYYLGTLIKTEGEEVKELINKMLQKLPS